MKRNFTTLQTTNVHIFKYMLTNAHRIIRMMNNPETPYETRHALRSALERIMACTNMDSQQSLNCPETVAILLRVGVVHQEGEAWQRAHAAHGELWEAFNERDRVENSCRWVKFDAAIRTYHDRCSVVNKPRGRSAELTHVSAESRAPVAQQIAA